MRVIYSDESGVGSEKDEPLVVVGALMLNMDTQWHPVATGVEMAIIDCLGMTRADRFEIRGRHVFRKIARGDESAAKLLRRLLEVIVENQVPVFFGAVNRAGFRFFMRHLYLPSVTRDLDRPIHTFDAFEQAFRQALARVCSYTHNFSPKERILWIHDEGRFNAHTKRSLVNWRHVFGGELAFLLGGSGGIDDADVSHVVDTIYFGNSQESLALQLADVCCSTISRYLLGQPAAEPFYRMIENCVAFRESRPLFEDAARHVLELRRLARESRKAKKVAR